MLVCDPTDRSPKPIVIDFVARLEEQHVRTGNAVAGFSRLDAEQPMVSSVAVALTEAESKYSTVYARELDAATHYAAMLEADAQQTLAHESAVRAALESGSVPPTVSDAVLIQKILSESKQARMDAYPLVEQEAATYINVARDAAGSRALLLALKLRPIVASYEPTITALREAEARASVGIDGDSLIEQFKREGLLQ